MEECIMHPNMIVHNKFLITEYTDDENLPREVLIRLKPKIEAIFERYNGKINYIPTDKNKAEGIIISFSGGSCFHVNCDAYEHRLMCKGSHCTQ